MQTQIKVSVLTYPNGKKPMARVRKAILDDNRPVQKWALSWAGKWIKMIPGAVWPDCTELEVTIHEAAPEENDGRR